MKTRIENPMTGQEEDANIVQFQPLNSGGEILLQLEDGAILKFQTCVDHVFKFSGVDAHGNPNYVVSSKTAVGIIQSPIKKSSSSAILMPGSGSVSINGMS